MKKLLSLALSLLMIFSVVPAFAITASAEYAENTVAVIGETEYATLFGETGALASAEAGDTIVLVKNVKEKGAVTLDKAITLDLAGFEIISYSTPRVITTSADITIRSTVDGLGETNTEAKASYGYSGALITSSANVTVDNVKFYEAVNFPNYDKAANLYSLDDATWEHKRYRYQTNYWGLGTYDNYTRTANTTLIPVKPSTTYYFDCAETLSDTFGIEVFSYKVLEDGDAHPDTAVTVPDGKEVAVIGKLGAVAGGILTTGSTTTYIGINVYCSNNEWGYNNSKDKIMPLLKNGTITPGIYEVIDLCARDTSVANTLVDVTADNTTLTIKNSVVDKTACNHQTAAVMNFTKATTFEVADTSFKFHNANGGTEFTINNAGAKGTFKNTTFSGNNAHCIKVANADTTTGITFENCTATTSGDGGKTALQVTGGLVTLLGGTFGNTSATNNTLLDGGKVKIDGTKFNSAKSGYALNITANADVEIYKATFVKSSTTISNKEIFFNSLAPNKAIYSSTEKNVTTIVSRAKDINSLSAFYVDDCMHYCVPAQEGSTVCQYCLSDTEIVHDYSEIKYNETQHWHVCSRCDGAEKAEDHAVGETGTKATCTTKPVCGLCEQEYGESLGHSFTDYQPVSTDVAGCEHNVVTKAVCDNGCGEESYDYSALTNLEVTKEAVAPTCTEIGKTAERSCTVCEKVIEPVTDVPANGHNYGEEVVEIPATYRTTGEAYKVCQVETCKYKYEYELPMLEYAAKYVAVIGEDGSKQFETLKAAIEAAADGDVIVLVKDVEEEFATTVTGKDITIDLVGHTLSFTTTAAAAITTDSDVTIRSTNGGWGIVDTGVEEVYPADPSADYYTIADISNPANWQAGQYSYSSGKYESYAGRACLKKLVKIDASKEYMVDAGTTNASVQLVLREYDKDGEFTKSIGALASGSAYIPSAGTEYISVTIYNSANSSVDFVKSIAEGKEKPEIKMTAAKALINYSKPLVSGSGEFTISNVKGVASANTSVFVSSATTDTPAKFTAKGCDFTLLNTGNNAAPINFTGGALEVDFKEVKIQSGKLGDGVLVNSEVFGTFKDCEFKKAQGNAITVRKTAADGIVLDGCQVSQSAYDSGVSTFSGGKTTLTGGTVFNGNTVSTSVIYVTGGTLIMDDVTLKGDKGTDSGRVLLSIASDGLDIQIKKATFIKGTANGAKGLICNNNSRFVAAIADNSATFFTENATSGEYAYSLNDTDFTNLAKVYVNYCSHDNDTTTCESDGVCQICLTAHEAYGHDNLGWDSDADNHWKVCSRCGTLDETFVPAAHTGGTADCDTQAICEICSASYGDVLGHDFTNNVVEYDGNNHWIGCEREGCDAAKDGTVAPHDGGTATCEDKPVCTTCEQEYGSELGHNFAEYISNEDAGCTTNGTETAVCANNCGESHTRTVLNSSLGHDWITVPETPPTCKETGLTEGTKCSRCTNWKVEQEVIPVAPHAHSWDAGKITVAGDCSHDTIYTYTCQNCDTTADHNFGKVENKHTYSSKYTVDVKATYFKKGSKSRHCIHCKTASTDKKTIAKLKLAKPKVKVTALVGKAKVKYTKVKGATHFQISYKVNGKWKNTKLYPGKKTKTVTITLPKGTQKIRIRAVVKKGSKKAYSAWRTSKSFTVK